VASELIPPGLRAVDEPTISEMLRDLQSDVQRLLDRQEQYVTKEILGLKLESLAKDQADLEKAQAADRERITAMSRWLWSGVVAPVIVGIILYVLIGKTP
jgi:hypothetical protein